MAFQPCPGVAEVTVDMLLRGVPVANVYHVRQQGGAGWTPTTLEAACQALADAYVAQIVPITGGNLQFVLVRGVDLSEQGGIQASVNFPGGTEGAVSSETLPNNCALCYTKRTARSGRNWRGRVYLPGITESQVNGNFLSSGVAATVGPKLEAVRVAMATATYPIGVLSRQLNKVQRAEGEWQVTTSIELTDERMDSSRGRLP